MIATLTIDQVLGKLRLGTERLDTAGDNRDAYGLALISIHGALEDFLRLWLADHPNLPPARREQVLDQRAVQWAGLLELIDAHAPLDRGLRRAIPRMNYLRQKVAHGGAYAGTYAELEEYTVSVCVFIKQAIDSQPAATARPPASPTRVSTLQRPMPSDSDAEPEREPQLQWLPIPYTGLVWTLSCIAGCINGIFLGGLAFYALSSAVTGAALVCIVGPLALAMFVGALRFGRSIGRSYAYGKIGRPGVLLWIGAGVVLCGLVLCSMALYPAGSGFGLKLLLASGTIGLFSAMVR